jgi:membrane protein implicated in regulation of membrane protease activity
MTQKNVGGIDRMMRIALGLILLGLAIAGLYTPYTWFGVIPLVTGLFSFCPFYKIIGLNSCPLKDKS